MADYENDSDVPWDDYRYDISTIIIENGVTRIGNNAFNNCDNIASVTIPEGITSIKSMSSSRR